MNGRSSVAKVHGPGSAPVRTPAASEAARGAEAPKITRHRLLVDLGAGEQALDLIHRDLFDPNVRVVVSALQAVAAFANPASLRFVAKLLGRNDKCVVIEAIRAIGAIGSRVVPKLLFEIYRTTRNDEVRCESLRALASVAPGNEELLHTLRDQALSPLASTELRTCCSILVIRLTDRQTATDVLSSASRDTIEGVLSWGVEHRDAAGAIVEYALERFNRLSPGGRKLAVTLAATSELPAEREIIFRGLNDSDVEVRSAAYRAINSETIDSGCLPRFVETMMGKAEHNQVIEEEAIAAIERAEELARPVANGAHASFSRLLRQSMELFSRLSTPQNRVGSETIELGWLILKSCEYLEYYGSEEFRRALVHYLRGGTYRNEDQLLHMLKTTATRVEVRHFDGYKALADIIRNPRRPGTALIVRELNITKMGKSEPFCRLIRNLRLFRLAATPTNETLGFVNRVFIWAREEKLYRLAEAALFVLTKFDREKVVPIFGDLLRLPIESKILAIACARLLKEVDASPLLGPIDALLLEGRESHILLNLVDALRTVDLPAGPGTLSGLITLLRSGQDADVARCAGRYLTVRPILNLFSRVTEEFDHLDEEHQSLVLEAINASVERNPHGNQDALIEFLYRFLRTSNGRLRGVAALILLRIGDEFAPKVISRLLVESDNEIRTGIIRALEGILDKRLLPDVLKLIPEPHAGLQEAIRTTLSEVRDPEAVELIRQFLLGTQEPAEEADDFAGDDADLEDLHTGMMKERQAFRFEHEFTKNLVVMFTDIQGYSAKAQKLTTMQINSLIQDYETILLPTIGAHRGRLVKRMGDGHMFAFGSPVNAGLAALRVQKALRRFNRYREELLRVVVRIGIHYGQVVERGGDLFGNNVNIASRLESSAKGGSILVSKAVWERWEGHIHARELGEITVKNISEPIAVYEPYEIQIDFPKELDPLHSTRPVEASSGETGLPSKAGRQDQVRPSAKGNAAGEKLKQRPASTSAMDTPVAQAHRIDSETVRYLSEVFGQLDELCARVERGELGASALREELGKSWNRFRGTAVVGPQEK